MAGIRGYNPNKLQKVLYQWGQGLRICKYSWKTWLEHILLDKEIVSLYHYFFFSSLSRPDTFFAGGDYKPYHWVVRYLELLGFEVEYIGGMAPFYIEATHSSGVELYFRSRGSTSLRLYTDSEDMWYSTSHYYSMPTEYLHFEEEVLQHLHFMLTDVKDWLL